MNDSADVSSVPWYRRTYRWGQTNITEIDPKVYDIGWWREHWRQTRVQGVILNAGGIVAYYPSRLPLQHRAEHLGDRDLLGELTEAARTEGLVMLARMDSNRADEQFYRAHPDWFAVDREQRPRKAGEWYLACVNSPYYKQYLPDVLREIIERYHPDGFTDNSWGGLGRQSICFCTHCQRKFRDEVGSELPVQPDWQAPAYRQWVRWSYRCRLENWDLNNRVTQQQGGLDCLWMGMVHADPIGTHGSFCDLKSVGERSRMMMCDHQSRDPLDGFERNGLNGKLLHGITGWDKVIPESMAMYVRGEITLRRGSNPATEARHWMVEGLAGGLSPWWHHVGAKQEDRRQFQTAGPVMRWHEANEEFLYNREPVANVGLVWSQDNNDFYGRDEGRERVALPWRGFMHGLTRARIPYLPVHADHILQEVTERKLTVLILPDLAAMSDTQSAAIREFVERGGSIVSTGRTGALDESGEPRQHFLLGDLLGIRPTGRSHGIQGRHTPDWAVHAGHNYLRLLPELNSGQQRAGMPEGTRHPILRDFDETDLIGLGGTLQEVEAIEGTQVIATYVPAFPIYPPEFSWMRQERTDFPAIVVRDRGAGNQTGEKEGRTAYLAADIDRSYGRAALPDHGDLLANLVRWAAGDRLPLEVKGPGYLDCHLYRQGNRVILHVVNLSGAQTWPGYLEEHLPVGPIDIAIRLEDGFVPRQISLQVSGEPAIVRMDREWARITVKSVVDHEMVVLERL